MGVETEPVVSRYERAEKFFERPLFVAAALVVPALIIEQSQLGAPWRNISLALNWLIWLAFLSEFLVLIYLTPDRGQWLWEHPLDLAIVLLTPPFLLSAFQPIRALRLIRLLRLMRLAQVSRKVFSLEGLRFAGLLTLLTTLAGGTAFASVERHVSLDDGLYWAITTITTVGSRFEPHSRTGELLTVTLVLVGAGFVTVLTGAIAQRFVAHAAAIAQEDSDAVVTAESALLHEIRSVSQRLHRIEQALLLQPTDTHDSPNVADQPR